MPGTLRRSRADGVRRPQRPKSSTGQTAGVTNRSARAGSARRRLAVASFRASRDGRIYTRLVVDASPVLEYVDAARARTGEQVTVTHVVAAALARAIREVPEARTRVVLGRARLIPGCAVSFTVDVDGGRDLAPVRVDDADTKSPAEIASVVRSAVERVRSGEDAAHNAGAAWARRTPWFVLRAGLEIAGFVFAGLGIPAFGQQAFPLGSALISNVGPLGLEEAFLAPLPMARVPLYLSIGAVHDAVTAVDGVVAVRPQLVLVATGDHRLIDGAHAGKIITTLRTLLAAPNRLDQAGRPPS